MATMEQGTKATKDKGLIWVIFGIVALGGGALVSPIC